MGRISKSSKVALGGQSQSSVDAEDGFEYDCTIRAVDGTVVWCTEVGDASAGDGIAVDCGRGL